MWKFIKNLTIFDSLTNLKKELKKKTRKTSQKPHPPLLPEEQAIVQQIKEKTKMLNINNVIRTQAYLDFYLRHPEIHWAFLGHMVSRNGGWNMTDLKGGMLPRLLMKKEAISFFTFLERGNWLIFQDAYPQFLLYEESLNKGKSLFYLLEHFNVSSFMEIVWNQFWKQQETYILAIALVINEQSYLEERVINNKIYKKEVFNTLEFKLQDFLSMNHILFPFVKDGEIKLIGQTLRHFESLHERILLGKRLYAILFNDKNQLKMVENWAKTTPHSGSRKDYWPDVFNDVDEGVPGLPFKPRLKDCKIVKGAPKIYSPKLEIAWANQNHKSAELGDWFHNWDVVDYLTETKEIVDGEIEHEYCKTLERLELAAITKKAISILD
ncbi:MAG TPA: DUF2515 domain-containing protein [Bacillus bacterium]|nr:DUF2515 domain-containing protein [Bacillus sp. (in: firmicutes)]